MVLAAIPDRTIGVHARIKAVYECCPCLMRSNTASLGDRHAAAGLTAPWGWLGLEAATWCLRRLGVVWGERSHGEWESCVPQANHVTWDCYALVLGCVGLHALSTTLCMPRGLIRRPPRVPPVQSLHLPVRPRFAAVYVWVGGAVEWGWGGGAPTLAPSLGVSPWGGACLHSPSGCNSRAIHWYPPCTHGHTS